MPSMGGVEILLVASGYRNWDKLRPDGPQLARMQTFSCVLVSTTVQINKVSKKQDISSSSRTS